LHLKNEIEHAINALKIDKKNKVPQQNKIEAIRRSQTISGAAESNPLDISINLKHEVEKKDERQLY